MASVERLFVYGSLGPGRPNAGVLADVDGDWEPATVAGSLVEDGWGAALGFLGLVIDNSEDSVDGWLFESDRLELLWDRLDEFEGDDYRRVVTLARRRSGEQVPAQVYVLSDQR